jgi:hypothetical protein
MTPKAPNPTTIGEYNGQFFQNPYGNSGKLSISTNKGNI